MGSNSENEASDKRRTWIGIALPALITGIIAIAGILISKCDNNKNDTCELKIKIQSTIDTLEAASEQTSDTDMKLIYDAYSESFESYLLINEICDQRSNLHQQAEEEVKHILSIINAGKVTHQ